MEITFPGLYSGSYYHVTFLGCLFLLHEGAFRVPPQEWTAIACECYGDCLASLAAVSCQRGVVCTFPLTLQGQPYGGCPSNPHPSLPCPNKNSPSKHTNTPNDRLAGRVLLRATSCVCVLVCVCY